METLKWTPKTSKLAGRKPPTRFYALLRFYLEDIYKAEQSLVGELSLRQIASKIGIPKTSYIRLREYISKNNERIEEAQRHNDWTEIELRLFEGYGSYQDLPSYKKALDLIRVGPRPTPVLTIAKKSTGRPKGAKNKPKGGEGEHTPAPTTKVPAPKEDEMNRVVPASAAPVDPLPMAQVTPAPARASEAQTTGIEPAATKTPKPQSEVVVSGVEKFAPDATLSAQPPSNKPVNPFKTKIETKFPRI